jgi:bifunctional non-homologous end joining protein LigD
MILRVAIWQPSYSAAQTECERLLICAAFVFLKNAMPREMRARLDSLPKRQATFIEPMECALVSKLPEGSDWTYEVKLDGYRAIGVKSSHEAIIYSRNGKNFNRRYPYLAEALDDLPSETVVDGEIVALDDSGRPDFHRLQHFGAQAARIHYFVFDLLVSNGRDLTKLPLSERREHLAALKLRSPRIRISEQFDIPSADMVSAVRQQQLEGVVAKRKSSLYQAGKRTGSWVKMRLNRGQEFVVGGFIPGPHGVDSIIVGHYRGNDLVYVARVRNGFVSATRRMVYEKLKLLIINKCPFVNLPETGRARWGELLDVDKMKKCVWVRPELVAVIEFLEWTEGDRLRHFTFVGLRDDKNPREVVKEA